MSRLPEARCLPSGLIARESTRSVCPSSTPRDVLVATSHKMISLPTAVARVFPPGPNATAQAHCGFFPRRVASGVHVARSQSLIVPSRADDASTLPSGEKARPKIAPNCPWRWTSSTAVVVSQTLISARSFPFLQLPAPVASSRPSGE